VLSGNWHGDLSRGACRKCSRGESLSHYIISSYLDTVSEIRMTWKFESMTLMTHHSLKIFIRAIARSNQTQSSKADMSYMYNNGDYKSPLLATT
jgi:hypothetical protein